MLNSKTNEIVFDPLTHIYTRNGIALCNVTTLLSKHGLATDFSMVDENTLAKAADKGKYLHGEIEDYINTGIRGFSPELELFIDEMDKEFITPISAEEIVYNEWLAGTVDLIALKTEDGEVMIDYKTSKNININAVRWQLSIYDYLAGDKRRYIYYCPLHSDGVSFIPLEPVSDKCIEELFACERAGLIYTDGERVLTKEKITAMTVLTEHINDLQSVIDSKTAELDVFKKDLMSVMKEKAIKSFGNDKVLITFVDESEKDKLNTDKLKEKYPLIAKELTTRVPSKAYVRITWRKEK